ncbi:MAG TPA: hypothetical protein VL200_06915 [Lacunisphaera sp.]|jgi:hypothetical protein|nr:hypothetical protein [Lacunisphaera sp.]
MTPAARFSSLLWLLAPLLAFGFIVWMAAARIHRIEYVTNLVETETALDPTSPTGYAGGLRKLIVPEHNNDSYQWIAQTQQMLAGGEWRVRHVSYDNAPAGRTVLTPSPFRWWLALVSWIDRQVAGHSPGLAVENAALYAGPALQLLLLTGVVAFVIWRFGSLSAILVAVAITTLFPFAGWFLAGQPDDNALVLSCALGGVLPLLAGIEAHTKAPAASTNRWFVAAGVAGGLGLWVDVARALPILAGIFLGALIAASVWRRPAGTGGTIAPLPWRHWALAGALTCLIAHLVEYFPGYLGGWPDRNVHPAYGLAWLGAGEVLARLTAWIQLGAPPWRWRSLSTLVPALLAVAAAPTLLVLKGQHDFFTADLGAGRLSELSGSPVGLDSWAWLSRDGFSLTVVATTLPLLLVPLGGWLLFRRSEVAPRAMCALALGPVLISFGFAWVQLRTWTTLDAGLLGLLVALAAATPNSRTARWSAAIAALALLAPGAWLLATRTRAVRSNTVTEGEVIALVERDLAYWLASQAAPDRAIVLAPPNLSASIYFHGGLRAVGTPYGENKDGFFGSVRIAAASSADEAQAVAQSRQLNYIVVPSWDNFLDDYARLGSEQPDHTLMASLHRWLPPRWLQPVPYQLPAVNGFEGQSVAVFRVVDVQDNATALSHLAEYFVEMGMIDQALAVANTLERSFPTDFGAMVARAQVSEAAGDAPAARRALQEIDAALKRGDTDLLAWDRQVSLAIVLVQAKRIEAAREIVKSCLADADATRLRMLTTVSLHRLLVMSRGFHLEIADPKLQAFARQLLPAELRDR